MRTLSVTCLFATIALMPVRGAQADQPVCASDVLHLARAGKALFFGKGVCFGCHGPGAKPEDIIRMNPPPTNLRTGPFKFPSDEQRQAVIRYGIKGTAMPPFRSHLTDAEILLLIEYLEVLRTEGC